MVDDKKVYKVRWKHNSGIGWGINPQLYTKNEAQKELERHSAGYPDYTHWIERVE